MGVLDDAIRDHLELKRRRGADPGELKREEDEALGMVPRGLSRREAGGAVDEPAIDEPVDEPPRFAELEPEPAVESQATMAFDPQEVAEALGQSPEPESADAEPVEEAALRSVDADPAPEAAEPDGEDPVGAEHDELEETPEFMQESPEHDKLWFEQRPPKDFDF